MKILWSVMLTVLLCSCNNSEADAVTPGKINTEGKLIQSYVVNDKWECFYKYNDDNSLQAIVYKTEGVVQCTVSFTYKNGKIVESLKKAADGSNTVKKQFEYKGDLIVKQVEYINGELFETSQYKYDSDDFLEQITTKRSENSYNYTKITSIEKFAGENKIKVKRTGVATHIITYDEKLRPECSIPAYQAIAKINNNGISGNILLTEIIVGNKVSTKIDADFEFNDDGNTVQSSNITYQSDNFLESQELEYTYM